MGKKLTVTDVATRLEQAANTLRKMPAVKVQGYCSFWPDILHSPAEAYGWEPVSHIRLMATSKQISEMDEALHWLLWLTPENAKIVFLRSNRVRWKVLGYIFGHSRTKLHTIFVESMCLIMHKHNEKHCKRLIYNNNAVNKNVVNTLNKMSYVS